MTGEVTGNALAVRATYGLLSKCWRSNEQAPRVGEKVEPGCGRQVNVHDVIIPVGIAGALQKLKTPFSSKRHK